MKKTCASLALTAAAAVGFCTAVSAAEYEVQMLNKDSSGKMWQFEPAFLKIAPGDTVTFMPADKGHNSEALAAIVPQGAASWKGKVNQPIKVTYAEEGAYKCLPHAGVGMVGVIQVGDSAANLDAVKSAKMPGKGKARLAELIAQVRN